MSSDMIWAIVGLVITGGGMLLGSSIWLWGYRQGCAVTREIMSSHTPQRKDRP